MSLATTTARKGREGEERIALALVERGWHVLHLALEGEFYCEADLLVYGSGRSFFCQCKNKEPRDFYADTGMERSRYNRLVRFQRETGVPLAVLFTDRSGSIYGDWLQRLDPDEPGHGNIHHGETGALMVYWWCSGLRSIDAVLS